MPFFGSKRKANLSQRRVPGDGRLRSNLEIAKIKFPLRSSTLEYRKSNIAGVGVFAKKDVRYRAEIIEYKGEILKSKAEVARKEKLYKCVKNIDSTYFLILKNRGGFIDGTRCSGTQEGTSIILASRIVQPFNMTPKR